MKLTILFGGASYEHEISIVSAITIKEKLSSFELDFVFCDAEHVFYLIDAQKMKATTFSSGEYKKMPQLFLQQDGFVQKSMFAKSEYKSTVINLVHGGDGEDGTLAALLEFYGLAFIGPRKEASVFSYDKRYTKLLSKELGVKSLEYEVLHKNAYANLSLSLPVIVKPASLGSSIGVSIVKEEGELDYALDCAFEYDENVLVEPFVEGVKEYNLAGYMANGEVHFSMIEEPQKEEFLDFDKKYRDFSRSKTIQKAEISESLQAKIEASFEKIYRSMFQGSLIRCDFFVINNDVYLNEINPIPGSMANYLFDDFTTVIENLVSSLPSYKKMTISYEYIHSISSAKGK